MTVVYSIVKKHRGHISVESDASGATFSIHLPAISTAAEARPVDIDMPTLEAKNVLVMDDDVTVRKVLSMMLTQLGCAATAVRDGAAAIEAYSRAYDRGEPFDAVIMDLTVTEGMGGAEAARKIIELDPKAALIVSSGYATDETMSAFRSRGFRYALKKPYALEKLADALRRVGRRCETT